MNRAFTSGGDGFDIAGVCTIAGDEIVRDPEKATPEFDSKSEAPLTVTADSVALAVKTIPGLTYRLLKATSLTGGYEVVIEADAKTTQLTLEAKKNGGSDGVLPSRGGEMTC